MVFPPVVTSAGTSLLLRFLQILFAGLLAMGIAACSPPGVSFDRVAGEDIDDGDGGTDPPPVPEQVVTPVFNLLAEPTEALSQRVTISTTTAGATIYFTRDGSNPTAASEEYTGTITLNETTTLTAYAVLEGFTDSEFAQTEVVIRPPPALDIRLGEERLVEAEDYTSRDDSFDNAEWEEVTLPAGFLGAGAMQIPTSASVSFPTDYTIDSARLDYRFNFLDAGTYFVWIRAYAANGSSDTAHVGLDGEAVITGETLRASRRGDWAWSNTQLGTGERIRIEITEPGIHTLNVWMREPGFIADRLIITSNAAFAPVTVAPTFSPSGGNFADAPEVTITSASAGARIFYTLDGTTPTEASTEYTAPITISETATLSAIARTSELDPSAVTSATYNITGDLAVVQPNDADGTVVIEAEDYADRSQSFDGFDWLLVTDPAGFVADGAMQVPDAANGVFPTDYTVDGARMDYRINFTQTGTHFIWIRGWANDGGSDTIHIGLDGAAVATAAQLRISERDEWAWSNTQFQSGSRIRINVPSTGIHTLNLWMRESGFIADRILLTKNNALIPTGEGPEETGFSTADTPTFTPVAGHYTAGTEVTLSSTTPGVSIYYTLDGSEPDSSSTLYTTPIAVTSLTEIRAIAIGNGYIDSEISIAQFSVGNYPPIVQPTDGDGSIIIEAENYTLRGLSFDDFKWELVTTPAGFVDAGAMQVPVAANAAFPTDYATDAARMDYVIDFAQADTYYVWVRGFAANGGRDTLHVGLNGVDIESGARLRVPASGDYVWSNTQFQTGGRIQIDIPEAGIYTLNLWMRESGLVADRILLTPDRNFTPTGTGPAETPIIDPGAVNTAPVLDYIPDAYVEAGTRLETDFNATDVDAVSPIFSADLSGLPGTPALTSAGDTGTLTWNTDASMVGDYGVTLRVSDAVDETLFDEQTFTIRVIAPDNPEIIQPGSGSDNLIVSEAELPFTSTVGRFGHEWQVVANSEATADNVLQALPELGITVNSEIEERAPRVDFLVDFQTTGTYYIWVRGIATDTGSDSVHVGLNGVSQTTGRSISGFTTDGELSWANLRQTNGQPARITVTETGLQAVSVWMREDGFAIDKFVLTTDAAFTASLDGPAASARGPQVAFTAVTDGELLAWSFNEDPALGSATDAIQNAALSCSTCPSATTGVSGNGLAFTGTQSFVLADTALVNRSAGEGFSIVTRVRYSAACAAEQGIVSRDDGSTPVRWSVGCDAGKAKAVIRDSAGTTGAVLTSATDIDDGEWHLITLDYDPTLSLTRLYVDDQVEDTDNTTFAAGFDDSDSDILLGQADFGSGTAASSATVDALAFFGRALQNQEVQRLALGHTQGLPRSLWACEAPVRIMPLGDSITAGSNRDGDELYGNYRSFLHDSLSATGYYFDFVGGKTSRHPGDPDVNHEGWPGFNADQIRGRINQGLLDMNPPELILLHIGTNSVATSTTMTENLLDRITLFVPEVPTVVAKIIDRQTSDANTLAYNAFLETDVQSRITAGDKYFLVDMESILNPASDYFDNLHQNTAGAEKIATVWFNQLADVLPRCGAAAPMLVPAGPLAGAAGTPWQFTPDVLGHPIGTFSASGLPAGMVISTETGELQWPVPTSGTFNVTVDVTNASGSDSETYQLVVP